MASKKKRGPAPTGKGTQIQVRLQPAQLFGLDAWIAKQAKPHTRPEAIRGMIDAMLRIMAEDTPEKPMKRVSPSERLEAAREFVSASGGGLIAKK
jgi:hypothetical protein